MRDRVRFTVLGPVRAWRDTAEVPLGPPQQRAVLAALLLGEGAQVPVHQLVDAVWGADAPGSAVGSVRTYVHRLRRLLDARLIRSVGDGYLAEVEEDALDLAVFRNLVARAERARARSGTEEAAAALRDALALWQGTALAGIRGAYAEAQRTRLTKLRMSALEARLAADLELGAHAEASAELADLVTAHPFDERFREMLMLALYRSGRQAAALATYREARRLLADELGVDPGPALRAMHERILRADDGLLVRTGGEPTAAPRALAVTGGGPYARAGEGPLVRPAPEHEPTAGTEPEPTAGHAEAHAPVPAPTPDPVPAQLPADLPVFVGREFLLSEAERLVTGGEPGTAAVVVGAVAGTAGVGKTAFAVRWAHRVAHHFPDGRLYLNLRGFDPAGPPVTPEHALRTAMEAFGLAPQDLPQDVDSLAARWRTLLSGRRVLLLLDNARDSRQVRPLLPGRPGCLVIVTSRNRLTGLVAADGAHPFHLDVLSPGDAREFLERRVGAGRVAAEPDAVEAIVEECARLPLALSVAAARAVISPGFPLAAVAEELRGCRDGTEGLDAFGGTEPGGAADIRAVFSWSYQALTPAAARLFRLLAVHPGSCIALPAAASLAGLPAAGTRRLVAELVGAHLLYEPLPGRFTTHDLLRAYAGELARALDTPAEQEAARRRILDHYLHSAHSAGQGYSAHRQAIVLPPPVRDVRPEEFADCEEGGAWFAAEQAALVAAVEQAAAHGFDRHTWQLAWAVAHHLDRRGLWHDLERTQRTAMDAAVRTGDPVARAHAHRGLGRAATELGRVAEARAHMERATELFAGVGDSTACAESHRQASWVAERQGDLAAALDHARRALAIHRDNGDAVRLAAALNAVGWCHTLWGQHREALDHCRAALTLQQRHKQPYGEADTWDSIGYAHHRLGQYGEAVTAYQNALAAYRTIDVAYGEADTLGRLGDTYLSTGRPERARATWTEALAILERLGHADAESVRARLRKLGRG